ncbi:MAG: 3-hydroxyacyl-ACP dehydratase FabZ [Pseudomonadota bacterium]
MNVNEIMRQLPHRYPFLLVDRVISYEPNQTLRAYKNVTFNEPFFQGHFPDRPIMPGVLIIEALAQAGAILAYISLGPEAVGQLTYVMALDNVRFRRPVVPGDRLDLVVEVTRRGSKYWRIRGEAFVGDKKVAEGDLMAVIDLP